MVRGLSYKGWVFFLQASSLTSFLLPMFAILIYFNILLPNIFRTNFVIWYKILNIEFVCVYCILHLFIKEPLSTARSNSSALGITTFWLLALNVTLWIFFFYTMLDTAIFSLFPPWCTSLEMFLASPGSFKGWWEGSKHSAWHCSHHLYAAKSCVVLHYGI